MYIKQRVSVIIPALNEEKAIPHVIKGLQALRNGNKQKLIDEIIVCDNGSTDHTYEVAKQLGAKVVYEPLAGYGRACLKAMNALKQTDIVLFIDADHAFYAQQSLALIQAIDQGYDLAIGSRTLGNMAPGALTGPQIFGNRLASYLIKLIWRREVSDLGPFRAIRYSALKSLNMQNLTFGWTIEMQIKALQKNMQVVETPVDVRCRIGVSKISGTIKGSVGAGIGILSMIAKLWWQQKPSTTEHHEKINKQQYRCIND